MKQIFVLIVLLAAPTCWSQNTATGNATTTGPCSPAVPGNNNQFTINCSGIGKEQGQKMLDILNKVLANALDPKTVMDKLNEILTATASAANTAATGLVVQERPWVSAQSMSVTEPLTFNDKGAFMTIAYALRNTGPTPALHVMWRSKLIPITMTKDIGIEIAEQQAALCDPMRRMPGDLFETTVFPNILVQRGEGVGLYPSDVETGLKSRESGVFAHKGFLSVALIACIDYQLSFAPGHHQTRYAYELGIPLGGGFMGDLRPEGTQPNVRLIYFSESED